jgi:hypothetical protein
VGTEFLFTKANEVSPARCDPSRPHRRHNRVFVWKGGRPSATVHRGLCFFGGDKQIQVVPCDLVAIGIAARGG